MAACWRHQLRGFLWGIAFTLLSIAGVFHVLHSAGVLLNETAWGVYVIVSAAICFGGAILDTVFEAKGVGA
jgi:hypothetical protein